MTTTAPKPTPFVRRNVTRAVWSVRLLGRKGLTLSATTDMVDSIESPQTTNGPIPAAILSAPAVGGYIAGNSWPTYFPYAAARPDLVAVGRLVSITLTSSAAGRCLDVEPGGATNTGAARWFVGLADSSDGKPIFYTSASNVQALINALATGGIQRDQYFIWSAHYTFVRHICAPNTCGRAPQCDGTQWTDAVPGNCDGSTMFSYVFQAASPPPPPQEVDMATEITLNNADGRVELWTINNNKNPSHRWIQTDGTWSAWQTIGCPVDLMELAGAAHPNGHLEVFAKGTDGNVYHSWQTGPNGTWQDPFVRL